MHGTSPPKRRLLEMEFPTCLDVALTKKVLSWMGIYLERSAKKKNSWKHSNRGSPQGKAILSQGFMQPFPQYWFGVYVAFNNGNLLFSQREGVTSLKANEVAFELQNWRPIWKLIIKLLRKQLVNELNRLGRWSPTREKQVFSRIDIWEISDIGMAEKDQLPGFLLSVDFRKAFDTFE